MTEALFWDCRDAENLTHSSPEEAIEEYLDYLYEKDVSLLDQIKKICPLKVTGYAREEITPEFISGMAHRFAEKFTEEIEEEYGDPEGDHPMLSPEDEKSLPVAFQLAFSQILAKATVWRCKVVETKTFTAEEVETMMRESNPSWFEEEA